MRRIEEGDVSTWKAVRDILGALALGFVCAFVFVFALLGVVWNL